MRTGSGIPAADCSGAGSPRAGIAPDDPLNADEPEPIGERLGEVELASGHRRPAVDDLRQNATTVVGHVDLHAARQHRMRDALRARPEYLTTGGALAVSHDAAGPGEGGVRADRGRQGARLVMAAADDGERDDGSEEDDSGERGLPLREAEAQPTIRAPDHSRPSESKS